MDEQQDTPLKIVCAACHGKYDVSDFEPFSVFNCPECGVPLRVPLRFSRYLLEKVCGQGGMATIYRAIDTVLERRIAIKVMKSDVLAEDPGGRRFLHSARLVARLDHPGIIPIYDCGIWQDQPYICMRYLDGGSLETCRREHRLPDLATLCRWIALIADGLEAARLIKIVHHDIKPGNILLTRDGEAQLGDFDLADRRERGDITTSCDEWASPAYASPERLLYGGEEHYGDIFSLGVTLYELIGNKFPFSTKGEAEKMLEEREWGVSVKLETLNPAVPHELSKLVTRMLAYLPEARPEYPEIIDVLSRCADGLEHRS